MVERTLIVVGPGGVGKSPLDFLLKPDIIKIDPYRLRSDGPRNASDVLFRRRLRRLRRERGKG